jgi:methylase of polypeptide subunit release factors
MHYESERIIHAYLTELSTDALVVAEKNKTTLLNDAHQEKTTLLHCSLLDHPTIRQVFTNQQPVASSSSPVAILLVANLPYIPDEMFANNADERITKREPTMAFIG